jgi:hypothetical protein
MDHVRAINRRRSHDVLSAALTDAIYDSFNGRRACFAFMTILNNRLNYKVELTDLQFSTLANAETKAAQ